MTTVAVTSDTGRPAAKMAYTGCPQMKAKIDSQVKDDTSLHAKLVEWANIDTNTSTQAALMTLLNQYPSNAADLQKRFMHRLEFGTAGLRAVMGPGFNCMNDVTVLQTSQGLAAYLVNKYGKERCAASGVVIGFDGRHNSQRFANVTAAVFLVAGFKVYVNSKTTATPMNPYGVVKKGCVAGIQVTASHNPKDDNGYKVYAANGAQIVPPMDTDVSDLILQNLHRWDGVSDLLCSTTGVLKDMTKTVDPYDDLMESYMKEMAADLCKNKSNTEASDLKIVYTAMHGVGWPFIDRILKNFGYTTPQLLAVEEQKLPDPNFSTVPFPNPEEKGALDIAMELADKNGSPMVIANDPDADRFACAEKTNGQWKIFHGDELGIIFGHRCMEMHSKAGVPKDKMLLICSAVSSRMLSKMCEIEGCKFEETMTGFKWMMNKAIECREKEGLTPVFVYEEALGYAVSMRVPDKDGLSAAGVWVELACELYKQGKTMTEHLDDLRKKYGYFVSNNSYFLCYDKEAIAALFAEFRNGASYMWQIGDYKVRRIRDVTTGYDSAAANKQSTFPLTPSSQMVTLFFEGGAVMTLRTSGTEPKLKWYSELSAASPDAARDEVKKVVDACIKHIMKPDKYPLKPAPP